MICAAVSVEGLLVRFWRVRSEEKEPPVTPVVLPDDHDDESAVLTDVPLIVEDLLCQVEDLRLVGGDPATVEDLLAQVELLQGR